MVDCRSPAGSSRCPARASSQQCRAGARRGRQRAPDAVRRAATGSARGTLPMSSTAPARDDLRRRGHRPPAARAATRPPATSSHAHSRNVAGARDEQQPGQRPEHEDRRGQEHDSRQQRQHLAAPAPPGACERQPTKPLMYGSRASCARPLDGGAELPLVPGAGAGQPARQDLAALGQEPGQRALVLVVHDPHAASRRWRRSSAGASFVVLLVALARGRPAPAGRLRSRRRGTAARRRRA